MQRQIHLARHPAHRGLRPVKTPGWMGCGGDLSADGPAGTARNFGTAPISRMARGAQRGAGGPDPYCAMGDLFHRPPPGALVGGNQIKWIGRIRRVRTEFVRTTGKVRLSCVMRMVVASYRDEGRIPDQQAGCRFPSRAASTTTRSRVNDKVPAEKRKGGKGQERGRFRGTKGNCCISVATGVKNGPSRQEMGRGAERDGRVGA